MTTDDSVQRLTCPRCNGGLQGASPGGVAVQVCGACHGTLLGQVALTPLLEALSAGLLERFDPDAKLASAPAGDLRTDCPRCRRVMDRDDYCAAGLVHFDRCNACRLLWIEKDALGTMTMMWARMNVRAAERRAHQRDASTAMAPMKMDRGLLGLAVWQIVGRTLTRGF
jgi:Zn-finger nucleic acid-binding protein